MTKKIFTLATMFLFVLGMFAVLAPSASALIAVEDNFDSNESGNGTLLGDTTDNGLTWTAGIVATGDDIQVDAAYGQSGNGAGSGAGWQSNFVSFGQTFSTGKLYLSYDIHVGDGSGGGFQPILRAATTSSSSIIIAHSNPAGPTGIYQEGLGIPTGDGANQSTKLGLFTAHPENVAFQAVYDLDANTLDITYEDIDNPSNGSGSYQLTGIAAGFDPNGFEIFRNSGAGTDIGIDNLRIATTPIPEPSSLFLLSLGCVALLATRRRRQV